MFNHDAIISWATQSQFSPSDLNCTTAVVLKILDHKCKIDQAEKDALLAIYDVIKPASDTFLRSDIHQLIAVARKTPSEEINLLIHTLRVAAEVAIDKPIMKAYKHRLRQGLTSCSQ